MTSQQRIAEQLFSMRKVRVEFHLDDGSVHQAWVVGGTGFSDTPRVIIEVNDFSVKENLK
jgi:hypothetical protein